MDNSKQHVSVIMQALNWAYDRATNGFELLGTAQEMAEEYLNENQDNKIDAANSLIRWQNAKATASGAVTSIGGFMTMPIAIPADMASTLYIQLKMIAAIAHIGGYDTKSDKVRTLVYMCLAGEPIYETLRTAGVQIASKLTSNFIQKSISGKMLTQINKSVGFRLLAKNGPTAIINLAKYVPIIGSIAGGSLNLYFNNKIGDIARNTFIGKNEENIFKKENKSADDQIIDII